MFPHTPLLSKTHPYFPPPISTPLIHPYSQPDKTNEGFERYYKLVESTFSLIRCLLPSCGICLSFLQRILAHYNFRGVRNLTRTRHIFMTKARLLVCRRSRQGRKRLFAFNLSLLRPRQLFQETRISPFSQPLQHHSNPHSTLSHITPSPSSSLSATPSTPAHTVSAGKRTGATNNHVGNNKKKHKPPPPPPPVRALHGLTLNIRGMTPSKWVHIQELPVFSTLDYIILTEHQFSADFRPDEIIKSGWDFHAVSGTVTTLPQRGYRGQRHRGGLALLTRNSTRFSITMHSLSGAVNSILGDNCTCLHPRAHTHSSGTSPSPHQAVTWSLSSPFYNDVIHLTGVYIFPNEGKLEEVFHTLTAHRITLPTNPTCTPETLMPIPPKK